MTPSVHSVVGCLHSAGQELLFLTRETEKSELSSSRSCRTIKCSSNKEASDLLCVTGAFTAEGNVALCHPCRCQGLFISNPGCHQQVWLPPHICVEHLPQSPYGSTTVSCGLLPEPSRPVAVALHATLNLCCFWFTEMLLLVCGLTVSFSCCVDVSAPSLLFV